MKIKQGTAGMETDIVVTEDDFKIPPLVKTSAPVVDHYEQNKTNELQDHPGGPGYIEQITSENAPKNIAKTYNPSIRAGYSDQNPDC